MAPPKHYLILPLLLLPYANICKCKRHCGLMVSALASHVTLTVPLSTQVYTWVLVNSMLQYGLPCNDHGLASHPGGSRDTPSPFMLQKPG